MRKLAQIALGLLAIFILADLYTIFGTAPQMVRTPATAPLVKHLKLGSIVRLVRDGRTFCSGTVVASNTVVTAAHCVLVETPIGSYPTTEPIEIRAADDKPRGSFGAVVYASGQMDQAVLKGDFSLYDYRPIITDPELLTAIRSVPGMKLTACGYPLGGKLYCNEIVLLGPVDFMWSVRGVLLPGMSGGPTMLQDGTLVAVNVAVERDFSVVSPLYNVIPGLTLRGGR